MIFTDQPASWAQLFDLPLSARIAPAPAPIVNFVDDYNRATGMPPGAAMATPDAAFVEDLRAAIEELPPVIRKKLEPRLLGIFFMHGVGASAVTDVIAQADRSPIGAFVVVDVDAFAGRTANGWASWKENSPFVADPAVHIQAHVADAADDNRQGALQYILLHEFGHVLAACEDFLPDWWSPDADIGAPDQYAFLALGWRKAADGALVPLAGQDFPGRTALEYYRGASLPAAEAPAMVTALNSTAFPTLYAATGHHDDFAECFATYVHEILLGKPHRLLVEVDGQPVAELGGFWRSLRSQAKAAFLQAFLAAPPKPFTANEAPLTRACQDLIRRARQEFVGLAPFLRLSIAGADLRQVAQPLLQAAGQEEENAALWLNLATAMFTVGQREIGLNIQEQALLLQRTYVLPATGAPRRRLLVLCVAGDIAENTPIDCLLEDGDSELTLHYATLAQPLPAAGEFDAVLVAIADGPHNRALLGQLEGLLGNGRWPLLNAPRHIPNTERGRASELLRDLPGVAMPPTRAVERAALQAVAAGAGPEMLYAGCAFPLIVRPLGSQAGRDLARLDSAADIPAYLEKVADAAFYVSRFVDYSGADGLFRKYRVALIDGQPYACHMGVSSHWMIHYVNAGMYEDAAKRAEEARFMADFAGFAARHRTALAGIAERAGLDYLCIDCAETPAGELLIFEIDHTMVVHAMDPVDLFPYKQAAMAAVRGAFEALVDRRVAGRQ